MSDNIDSVKWREVASDSLASADEPTTGKPRQPRFLEVAFPPDEEGVATLVGCCDQGKLPVCFGTNVTLESYNEWLGKKEDGLRVSYDEEHKVVVLREGCALSHGTTRHFLLISLTAAFAVHGYSPGLGRLTTAPGLQDASPDCILSSGAGAYPVLAEVGNSQSIDELNQRADFLLGSIPGAAVVVLIKVFDTAGAENGRMVAWCATHDPSRNLVLTAMVEFGRTGPGGVPRTGWVAGSPPPSVVVPAHNAVPAMHLPLDTILSGLRGGGGMYWAHPPAP